MNSKDYLSRAYRITELSEKMAGDTAGKDSLFKHLEKYRIKDGDENELEKGSRERIKTVH